MTTRLTSKWFILSMDLFTVAVSFFLAYFIRFNLTVNFDMSKMALQLPMVLLIGLAAFLITGSSKGEFGKTGVWEVNSIFKAVGLSSILLILLTIINHTIGFSPEFNLPLSIIIIYGLLSLVGFIVSRYIIKIWYNFFINRNLK